MENKTKASKASKSIIKWAAFGLALFVIGFITDGRLTDPAHHAVFILAGVVVGIGISK